MLRLRHVDPNGWHRALFVEGAIGVAGLGVLADLASAWLIIVFPLVIALVVKFHDLVAGALRGAPVVREGESVEPADAPAVPRGRPVTRGSGTLGDLRDGTGKG